MSIQAGFALRGRNPDVLTCIANLSNDEVFTPPEFANRMLDTLAEAWAADHGGASLWADKTVRFLDPCTKSGVFLREITGRLTQGLADEMPDLQQRVNHILTRQVYGIGITHLTSLLARRSVYCSKHAQGKHSIAKSFAGDAGNIWFERMDHTWADGRCAYCGASARILDRGEGLETHAYAFIHTDDIKARVAELFGGDMQFDVIIGNPPYQLSDGGGTGSSAVPIYHRFVDQARSLEPRFLVMVVPAKWYTGGKGLDEFRGKMLADSRIRYLADFPDSRDAFSGVDVAGGVCYFLWNRDSEGSCFVETFAAGKRFGVERQLDEFETFIRDNRALKAVHKVRALGEPSFSTVVSSRKPFGIESAQTSDARGDLYLFSSRGDGKIRRRDVPKGHELIDVWKVLLSKTSSEHAGQTDRSGMKRVLSRIEVMPPGSVSTESYLVIGPVGNKGEAHNVAAYLRTKFVRFLVSTILLTQNISKGMFEFVPIQDFSRSWTDDDLYAKYGLSSDEITFIETTMRPMEADDEQAHD